MSEKTLGVSAKLDEVLAILRRIEERQIKTTEMVQEVTEEVQPRGSFATTDYQKSPPPQGPTPKAGE